MALTRKFLIDLGIEKDQIQSILDEHGNTVELVKEKAKEDAEKAAEKLNDRIAALQDQIDNAPEPGGEDYKAKYEAEVKAHGETKTAHEQKETLAAKRILAKKTLLDSGVSESILEDFMLSALDYDAIEVKDGQIGSADKFIAAQKERYGKYFGTVETKGTEVATPPANSGNSYSGKTATELMEEANKNPENLTQIMSQIEAMNKQKKE